MREQDSLVNLTGLLSHPKTLQDEAHKVQRSIAWETMVNRGIRGFTQYGLYFALMWIGGLRYPEHADLIRSGNFYWRWVDDVADGDRPLPEKYRKRDEFLQHRKAIVKQLFFQPEGTVYGEREDILLAHYYFQARRLGIDLAQESVSILDSIIWDEERARNRKLLTQKELNDGINKVDFACIDGGFKVADEPYHSQDLHALSWAVRTMFNLRDFPRDFAKGLINISREDIERYNVNLAQLEERESVPQLVVYEPMRRWYKDQVAAGRRFLDEALNTLSELHLKWITRFVLNVNFVDPTRRNLNRYAKMVAA